MVKVLSFVFLIFFTKNLQAAMNLPIQGPEYLSFSNVSVLRPLNQYSGMKITYNNAASAGELFFFRNSWGAGLAMDSSHYLAGFFSSFNLGNYNTVLGAGLYRQYLRENIDIHNDYLSLSLLLMNRFFNTGLSIDRIARGTEFRDTERSLSITVPLHNQRIFLSAATNFMEGSNFDIRETGYSLIVSPYSNFSVEIKAYTDSDWSFFNNNKFGIRTTFGIGRQSDIGVKMSNNQYSADGGFGYSISLTSYSKNRQNLSPLGKNRVVVFEAPSIEDSRTTELFSAPTSFELVAQNLEGLKYDESVSTVVVRVGLLSLNWGQTIQLRDVLLNLKNSGIEVIFVVESGGLKEFYLASSGHRTYVLPSGFFSFKYPHYELMYYKGLLNRIGIEMQFVRFGEYKSAVEPFSFDSISVQSKTNKKEVLNDFRVNLIKEMGVDIDSISENVLLTPTEIVNFGIAKDTAYLKELLEQFSHTHRVVPFSSIEWQNEVGYISGTIAVVDFDGTIVNGKSRSNFLTGNFIGSTTFSTTLRELDENENVKGIIIRMNSPGGSAMASDIMYRAIRNVSKPVYVYIEGSGASGAYLAACGADKIFASKFSIVGSIGIFYGKPVLQNLYDTLGLRKEKIFIGERDDMFSETRRWDSTEVDIISNILEYHYDRFLSIVSNRTGIVGDSLDFVAGGKVFTGWRAQQLGLVDEIGTFNDVVRSMKEELDGNFKVEFVSRRHPLFSAVRDHFITRNDVEDAINSWDMFKNENLLMLCPWELAD